MAKKLKPREIAALQEEYIAKREELLQSKVNALGVTLFEKVYNSYLIILEQNNGKLLPSERNVNMIRGLDAIYNLFRNNENAQVIKSFVSGVQGITPLNERYFESLTKKDISKSTAKITGIIDRRLGIDENGSPKPGGFVDKFIRDEKLLKKIKKTTTQGITKQIGIQELRKNLKEVIQGDPSKPLSGGLHQYYRNYAYDTYIKVDRMGAELYAKDLGMRYFYWVGGLIKTSRPICEYCNGKILDGTEWNKVTSFTQLKEKYRDGMDKNTDPSQDLGGYACRHRKRFVLDSIAEQNQGRIININSLLA